MSPNVEPVRNPAAPSTPERERRASRRFRIVRRCLVWPEGSSAAAEAWHCIAYDISTNGIGLAVPLPPRLGTFLTVEVAGLSGLRRLRVRVAHVRPVAYLWFCGCELDTPLQDDELRAWLRPRG